MKIFTKYIIKKYLTNIVISLALFTFILMMDKIFQLVTLIIEKGVEVGTVLTLLLYSLPTLLAMTMPMGVIAAGIMTCSKLVSENEITAMRTSGCTLKPVVLPILRVTFIITILMFPFNYQIAPRSQYEFRKQFMEAAFKTPTLRLEENTLIEIKPYTLFAHGINQKEQVLEEVIIHKEEAGDGEPAVTINAREGSWATDSAGSIKLSLSNGSIKYITDDEKDKLNSMQFKKYNLVIKIPAGRSKAGKDISSMTGGELREEIHRLKSKDISTSKLSTRYYLRGALAGASFVLILVGLPLGLRTEKKGKYTGFAVSLGVIAVYYIMIVAGIKTAFNEYINPFAGVWLPNLITAAAGIYMLYRANRA